MKRCSKCGVDRLLAEFHKRSDGMADGLRAHCKPCVRADNRARYKANGKTWARRYDPEYDRQYRLSHPKPHDPVRARLNYLARRDHALEVSRRWAAANRDRKTQATANYRARKAGVFRERIYRKKVWEQHGGLCGICYLPCDPTEWHLDHIIPIFRGGEHSYANVQPAHPDLQPPQVGSSSRGAKSGLTMDNFREVATFLVGLTVLAGCGLLIFTSRGSEEQAWLMVGIILAYYFNRQQQSSAVRDVMNSQPTVVTTAGPPPTTTVAPPDRESYDNGDIPAQPYRVEPK